MKEFKITFNDYMNAQHLFLGWKRWFIPILTIPVILFILFSSSINYYSSLFISFILIIIVIFLLPSFQRKRFIKIYNSLQYNKKTVKAAFNDDYIEWSSDKGSDRLYWKEIKRYRVNKDIIIILGSGNIMHPIPASAFDGREELDRFLKLLNRIKNNS